MADTDKVATARTKVVKATALLMDAEKLLAMAGVPSQNLREATTEILKISTEIRD